MTNRPVLTRYKNPQLHWVGDGFLTQGMLPYQEHADATSPFILVGYNPAKWFSATSKPRGVGMHPHRGFETVTIAFQGGVRHGDTMGNTGEIGAGDVQWMTAARGVQHEEFHSDVINTNGGTLEMVQLWVNLPASRKMDDPRYQSILSADIPEIKLGSNGRLRVIAGQFEGVDGAAETASPLHVWDVYLPAGEEHEIDLPEGWSISLLNLTGKIGHGEHVLDGTDTTIFSTDEGLINIKSIEDAHYLVLAGQPLNEPIAMGGPFVMNTEMELREAYADFRAGRF